MTISKRSIGRPAVVGARAWAGLRGRDQLAATSIPLMANAAITSAMGVVFWVVAGRLYPASRVGADAALVSAMMLLSLVSQLNLSMGIPRLLPQIRSRRWRPVLATYATTAGLGLIVATCFVVLAPRIPGLAFLRHDVALGVALITAVVAWNVFVLEDAVLTASRWAAVVPFENGAFGALKIVLLVVLAGRFGAHGIFAAWVIAMVLTIVPVNALVFSKVLPSGERAPEGSDLDATTMLPLGEVATVLPISNVALIARYVAADYGSALLSQGGNMILPLLVIAVLGAEANAYFFIAYLIATSVAGLTLALSTSLVVEGAHDESALPALARRTLHRYMTLVVPAVVLMIAGAGLILAPFGPDYPSRASGVLRLLLAGTLPQGLVTLYLGVERVRARATRVLAIQAVTVASVTVGAVVGMRTLGLNGVGLAWLASQLVVALLVVRPLKEALSERILVRGTSAEKCG